MDATTAPRSRKTIWIIALLVLLLIVVGAFAFAAKIRLSLDRKSMAGYQAIFLNNNQVYFGKMQETNRDWVKLTDVYYLQVTGGLQQAGGSDATKAAEGQQSSSEMKLVKLGSELHGPQDVMYIGRDKVLFWENLKDDSKVVEAINKYKSK
ncbi:MAG: hypothetical protein ACM3NH_04145 [Candidatus Saccharibacteria bacterium]